MREALDGKGEMYDAKAVTSDFKFHLSIAQASGNHYFADIISHLGASIIPRTRLSSVSFVHDDHAHFTARLTHEHEAIYEAIARQDSEAAKKLLCVCIS